jgi:glycosyltransferase involved in cell wall biosynthesis
VLERRWKRLAERLAIGPRVEWLGWQSYRQVQQQYAWADVFAFTSLRDNSGNVVLEALANGLPIVCLDHQGVRDIVTEPCGIKVPVSTPRQVIEDLRTAIALLARDFELRQRMSEAALVRARDYLWSTMSDKMHAIYQRFVAGQAFLNDSDSFRARGPEVAEVNSEVLAAAHHAVPFLEETAGSS